MTEPAPTPRAFQQRRAGILLHPTSLPGSGGVGDMGPEAYRFVDLLAEAGISVWQMLPLGPPHADGSPYQCLSVHGGNPALISLERLRQWGWLETLPTGGRDALVDAARAGFERAGVRVRREYDAFREREAYWLDDLALYLALRREHGGRRWLDWPVAERDRRADAMAAARKRLAAPIERERFVQYMFFRQWHALRDYANERGVLLFGDLPIFVAYDSADVWACREYFRLDDDAGMEVVAGVPPDYFSETGQLWGNPLYRWERMAADGYRWWIERFRTQLELFDLLRIDHFRGFQAYWEVPADAQTAVEGRWVEAPGAELFETLRRHIDPLPLVAEDLGVITPEVEALRRRFSLPGMKILQFAFDSGPDNPYLPHNHEALSVVYTGTHDNDTTVGWFESLTPEQRAQVLDYLGHPDDPMPWPLIRAALASVARLAVIPMQDLLGLGGEHRMNRPGTTSGNWSWRFSWDMVPSDFVERVGTLVRDYERSPAAGE